MAHRRAVDAGGSRHRGRRGGHALQCRRRSLVGTQRPNAHVSAEIQLARPGAEVRRIQGADRYATAVAIAQDGWPEGSPVIFASNGATFADALSAGPLAADAAAPLLLVAQCDIPGAVREELARALPSRIGAMGGETAICDRAYRELDTYASVR